MCHSLINNGVQIPVYGFKVLNTIELNFLQKNLPSGFGPFSWLKPAILVISGYRTGGGVEAYPTHSGHLLALILAVEVPNEIRIYKKLDTDFNSPVL